MCPDGADFGVFVNESVPSDLFFGLTFCLFRHSGSGESPST
jgi:hypothetical protein